MTCLLDVGTFVANITLRGTLIYRILVSLSGRAPLIVSDLIVLFATWKRAAGTVRRAARSNVRVPLSEALLRDGKILTHVSSQMDYWTSFIGTLFFLWVAASLMLTSRSPFAAGQQRIACRQYVNDSESDCRMSMWTVLVPMIITNSVAAAYVLGRTYQQHHYAVCSFLLPTQCHDSLTGYNIT